MATRKRKIRKLRGSRTHGWGVSGQHRKHGSKGGRGNAGWCKHKWTLLLSKGIRKGKKGFTPPLAKEVRAINVGELSELISKLIDSGRIKAGQPISFDLGELGYSKILGEGQISIPIEVKAEACSRSALEKIEGAGGKVILSAPGGSA
ncbi:MAG: uL15 family ribosomal protein [Candidatus Bathyarchaeia archaeon]